MHSYSFFLRRIITRHFFTGLNLLNLGWVLFFLFSAQAHSIEWEEFDQICMNGSIGELDQFKVMVGDEQFKEWMDSPLKPVSKDPAFRRSPLYQAIAAASPTLKYRGNATSVFKWLIDQGGNTNQIAEDGYSLLSLAIFVPNSEIVECLIKNNVDTTTLIKNKYTPQEYAQKFKPKNIECDIDVIVWLELDRIIQLLQNAKSK